MLDYDLLRKNVVNYGAVVAHLENGDTIELRPNNIIERESTDPKNVNDTTKIITIVIEHEDSKYWIDFYRIVYYETDKGQGVKS